MIEVKVDLEACEGYGNCVLALPSVFDVDPTGQVILLQNRVDDALIEGIRRATMNCPANAIRHDG